MRIRVLGCYGAEFPGYKTMSFLINDSILLDAGSVTSTLDIDEQDKITDILITHSHLDHIKDILFLADNMAGRKKTPINLIATDEIISIIRSSFLNNTVWPDFTLIPTISDPVLRFKPIKAETSIKIDDLTIKTVSVNHTVECVSYFISDNSGTILHCGDTGPTERIWELANGVTDLKAIFIETSFPNEMVRLAEISKHLTPKMLKEELNKLKNTHVPVYVVHMKPQYSEILKKELTDIRHPNLYFLQQGQELEF